MRTILNISTDELAAFQGPVHSRLEGALAIRVAKCLDTEACHAYVQGVYAGRDCWVGDFNGEQFSLGRAWYTHLEQGRSALYFANAAKANDDVNRFAPNLQKRLIDLACLALKAPVLPRPRWCGPGIQIFPAGSEVAKAGGVVHFDLEGLTPAQRDQKSPTLTLILMLQAAKTGGGLRIWDRRQGEGEECDPGADIASELLNYQDGDLVFLDSYRLHQIQAFGGDTDRITATAHLVLVGNSWEIWF